MCLLWEPWSSLLCEGSLPWRREHLGWCVKDVEKLDRYLAAEQTACAKALGQEYAQPFQGSKKSLCVCWGKGEAYQSREKMEWHDTGQEEGDLTVWPLWNARICNLIIEAEGMFFFRVLVGHGRRCLDLVFFCLLQRWIMRSWETIWGSFLGKRLLVKELSCFLKEREQEKVPKFRRHEILLPSLSWNKLLRNTQTKVISAKQVSLKRVDKSIVKYCYPH